MRFEISILTLGALATVLLLLAAGQGFTMGEHDDLTLHLLVALPALLGAALPHVWVALYLLGTRRALGREPGTAGDLPEARALGVRSLVPVLGALAAIVLLVVTGASVYTGVGDPRFHSALFWLVLVAQPAALAVEWRMLVRNHRLLVRHGG